MTLYILLLRRIKYVIQRKTNQPGPDYQTVRVSWTLRRTQIFRDVEKVQDPGDSSKFFFFFNH